MKNFIKKAVSFISVASLLSPVLSPSIQAQEMTPSQLLINVYEHTDLDAIEEIETGSFNLSGTASVTGIEGFEFDFEGDAFGSFLVDLEEEDIQFAADGDAVINYKIVYHDSEGNIVTEDDPQEYEAAIRLVDQIAYVYDGTSYYKEDISQDIQEFFDNYHENIDEIKKEIADFQSEILASTDESMVEFNDKYYDIEENDDSYTLTLNTDFDSDEFLEDFRQTSYYDDMMGEFREEYNDATSNDIELEHSIEIVEEFFVFFVNSIDTASTTFDKESYLVKEVNFGMTIAAADIFNLVNRLEETLDQPLMEQNERARMAMIFGRLHIEFDVNFAFEGINEPVEIEAPANADEYKEIDNEPASSYEYEEETEDEATLNEEEETTTNTP